MKIFAALLALSAAAAVTPAFAQPAALEAPVPYVVQAGDTLIGIGARYLARPSDYRQVQTLNNIRRPRRLAIGAVLSLPYALLKSEPAAASLVAFRGAVTVTNRGVAVSPSIGLPLAEGFTLATGPDSFLTLEFEDGSRTTLPSRSRLAIQRLRKLAVTGQTDRILSLQAGRGESVVQPLTAPKDRFVVTTPLAAATVRGTQFRVAYDEDSRRTLLEVVEGKVGGAAEAAPAEVLTPAGFGAVLDGVAAPIALLPAPKLDRPGRVQDDATVNFTVAPVDGARRYRAQLASDAGFVDLIAEAIGADPTLDFGALPDGDYFVRLRAVDGTDLEGLASTYAVERRLNSLGSERPQADGRRYRFRWNSVGAGVASFRFQLSTEPGGAPLVDETGLTTGEIVVTDLPPGVYYWRVLITRTQNGRASQRWSEPERFELGGG